MSKSGSGLDFIVLIKFSVTILFLFFLSPGMSNRLTDKPTSER